MLALCSLSALASVTVNSPANGAVASKFTLSAVSTACSGQTVSAMGFSLDSSTNTTIVNSTNLDATVTATAGSHTLHVKSWGGQGASCGTDVALTVTDVAVSTPGNGATLTSPFTLAAGSLLCSSQPVASMGYSLDYGTTSIVMSTAINTSVTASAGAHTLHVKSWGDQGAACDADVDIEVTTPFAVVAQLPSAATTATANCPCQCARCQRKCFFALCTKRQRLQLFLAAGCIRWAIGSITAPRPLP